MIFVRDKWIWVIEKDADCDTRCCCGQQRRQESDLLYFEGFIQAHKFTKIIN